MNKKYDDFAYVFHSTKEYSDLILTHLKKENLNNCEVVSDNKQKSYPKKVSIAVSKSGTVSLEICNAKIPSVIFIRGSINFTIIKMLLKLNLQILLISQLKRKLFQN